MAKAKIKKTKSSAGTATIIDVSHADDSAPAGNSKSVIVGNRTLLRDPMMAGDTPALSKKKPTPDDKPVEKQLPKTLAKPPSQSLTTIETESDKVEIAASTDPTSIIEPVPQTELKPEPEPPARASQSPADTDEAKLASDDKPAPKVEANQEIEAATADKDQAEHQATLQRLVDSKQYFLPIKTAEKRRSQRFVFLGALISLLLAAAWANIALDAGLIQLENIKPVTHFFSS